MSLIRLLNHTSWPRILAINSLVIILSGAITAHQLTATPTQTTTKASLPSSPPPPHFSPNPPTIKAAQPIFSQPGDAISLSGSDFGAYQWDSTLTLTNTSIESQHISSWSDHRINFIIPPQTPNHQLLTLTLTVDQRSVTTPIAVYDPSRSMEFGLNPDQTTLYVNQPPSQAYVLVGIQNPQLNPPIPTIIQQSNQFSLYRLALDPNTHPLLTSTTPLTLTHLIPLENPDSTQIELPYYISPQNPLNTQAQSLQSHL